VVAALGLALVKLGLEVYFDHFADLGAIYGSLGAAMALLLFVGERRRVRRGVRVGVGARGRPARLGRRLHTRRPVPLVSTAGPGRRTDRCTAGP
jgi:hypothetical protein